MHLLGAVEHIIKRQIKQGRDFGDGPGGAAGVGVRGSGDFGGGAVKRDRLGC